MGIDKFIKQNGRINTNLWNTSFIYNVYMFIYKCLYINEPKDQNESFLHKMFQNYK